MYSLSFTLCYFVNLFRGKRGKGYNVPDDRVWGVSPVFCVISASVLGVVWWIGADSPLFAVSCPFGWLIAQSRCFVPVYNSVNL